MPAAGRITIFVVLAAYVFGRGDDGHTSGNASCNLPDLLRALQTAVQSPKSELLPSDDESKVIGSPGRSPTQSQYSRKLMRERRLHSFPLTSKQSTLFPLVRAKTVKQRSSFPLRAKPVKPSQPTIWFYKECCLWIFFSREDTIS